MTIDYNYFFISNLGNTSMSAYLLLFNSHGVYVCTRLIITS